MDRCTTGQLDDMGHLEIHKTGQLGGCTSGQLDNRVIENWKTGNWTKRQLENQTIGQLDNKIIGQLDDQIIGQLDNWTIGQLYNSKTEELED